MSEYEVKCPVHLGDVDLFGPGAQEHWYAAYDILHNESPVHRLPGQGMAPGSDAFVLTKHDDIAAVVRDQDRFEHYRRRPHCKFFPKVYC